MTPDADPEPSVRPRGFRNLRFAAAAVVAAAAVLAIADPSLSGIPRRSMPVRIGGFVQLKAQPGEGVFKVVGRGVANGGEPSDWRIESAADPSDVRIVTTAELRGVR